MMKDFTISNMLDLNETIAAELFEGKTYPWEVLPEIGDFIIKLGKTLDPSEYEEKGENVWIARSATVAPTASITGPAIIGRDADALGEAEVHGSHRRGRGPPRSRSPRAGAAALSVHLPFPGSPQKSHAIPPGQFLTLPTNVAIPTT